MPYKKGPKNSLRYYDPNTGRYAPSFSIESTQKVKKKKTAKEKEQLKKESLINHAKKSNDKYVYEIFDFLEKNTPGCVILVNEKVYHKKIKKPREVDILTKDAIIEVKSGKVRHKSSQFLDQQDLAKDHNKQHIVYAPDITDKKYAELSSKGIIVARNKKELLERMKK